MEDINENNFPTLFNILNQYREEFVRVLKQRLEQAGRKASGNLLNSINTNIKTNGSEIAIYLISLDYLKQTTDGRPPTRNSGDGTVQKKIFDWLQHKNILPRPMQDKNGKTYLPTQKQLSYLIARKIHKEGFTGDNILDGVIQELNNKYISLLNKALEEDFKLYLNNILSRINNIIQIY